jgi:hypothetical protein
MKVLANAAALVVALSIMGGLILAQRDYQNSLHEPNANQISASEAANASTPEQPGEYTVVMR